MNKFKTNIIYRIAAVVLALVFGTMAATGGLVTTFTYEMGLYTRSLDSVIEDKQEIVQEMASMQIFQHREDIKNNRWTLPNSNIEYGIIQAENLKNKDLADRSIYWDYHFQSTKPSKYSYVSQCMNEGDEFEYKNRLLPSLTGYNLQHFHTEEDITLTISSGVMPVWHIDYCKNDGIFYYTTDSHSYSVTTIGIKSSDATPTDEMLAEQKNGRKIPEETYPEECPEEANWTSDLAFFQLDQTTRKYVSISGNYQDLDTSKYKQWKTLYLDTFSANVLSILQMESDDLLPKDTDHITTSLISPEEVICYTANDDETDRALTEFEAGARGLARYSRRQEQNADQSYWIVSQVKPKDKWVTEDDLIAKQYYTLTALYNYRYLSLAVTVIASILALLAVAFCIYSAGYRQVWEDDDRDFCGKRLNVLLTWRQRIPLEIYIIGAVIVFCILTNCVAAGLDYAFTGSMPSWLAAIATEISLVATLGWGLMFCMNIAHRIHGEILGKYALCHRIWGKFKELARIARQNTPLLLKGAAIFAGISLIELTVIVIFWDSFLFLVFWGWMKIVEFALVGIVLIQMKTLQKGSKDLAEGNLSQQMDTAKMFWEFRKHGDNLNKIHQGMAIALEEQMKSERFKTELITNVSHDIKTPLTSIINYVDLLQKEGLTENDRTEYLEVLDRQSKRMKKLIEDLIEASKASTGNLSVSLEPCNIDILLTQTVGEFQEKLSAASLELITNGTGKDIHIQADSRHLWRIFDNLMNNICKYAQPGTRVYISQEVSGNHVSLIFRNTSKDPLNISVEELMERFVRGDSSRNTEGNGLGLSIARSLTELMGGSFQIRVDGDLFKVIVRFSL